MQYVSKTDLNQSLITLKTDLRLMALAKDKALSSGSTYNFFYCEPKPKLEDRRSPKK